MRTKVNPLGRINFRILKGLLFFAALAGTGNIKAQCSTTITSTGTLICAGSSATLTSSAASSYTWTGGSNSSSLVVSPTITTTYSLSTTDALGCVSSSSITIAVNNTPTVTAVVSATSVCAGKSVTMTANGATSYTWTNGVTNAASYTPAATSDYTVTGSNACGTASAVVSVTVFALPSVSATATSPSVCAGGTVTLNGAGASNYTWTPVTVTNNVAFTPTISRNYTVTGVSANGCIASATIDIGVVNNPTVIASTSTLICSGDSPTITSDPSANTYSWSTTATSSFVVVSPTISTVYSVTATNAQGCSATRTIAITVNNTPTVTAAVTATSVCYLQTVTMTAGGANSYAWTGGVTNGASFVPFSTSGYTVTGTNACGTATAAVSVTVFALPSVSATASSPSVCAGGTVVLNGTGAVTYTWNPVVVNNGTFIPAATQVYTVTGTNANGCVGSKTISVEVVNIPTVTAVVSNTSVCAGKSVTMTANGATNYTWTNGVTNATSYTPAATSSYTVTGDNACGTSSAVVSVTVFALPSVSATASSPSVCAGGTVILNGAGASNYTWTPSPVANNTTFTPSTSRVYTVNGTDANGCVASTTINVDVINNPTVIASTSTLICSGASPTITSDASATTYSWSTAATTSFVVVSPTVNTVYSVTATNAQGCSATRSIAITVNNTPTVSAVVTSTAVCAGKSVTMTASGATTYTWTGGVTNGSNFIPTATSVYTVTGGNACGTASTSVSVTVFALPSVTATATSPSICAGSTVALQGTGALTYTWTPNITNNTPFSPTVTATYTVSGTDGNGCISVNSMTTITVVKVPTVTAVTSATRICAGKSVTLTANGATSYTWTNGVTNAVSYTPAATSDYTVTGANACGTSSAVVSVTVDALPNVTASASSPSVCSGNTVILNGGGSPSYTWSPNVANNTTFTPQATTNYSVTGIAANGCTAQAVVGVTVVNTPSIVPVSSSTAICIGSTATISATGAAGYTWTAANFAGANSSSIVVSPTVTTSYTVERANSTCTTSAVVSLVVNSLPTITASSNATVCACTQSVVISASGGSTYVWNPTAAPGASLTVFPCASTVYTVTGSNAFCSSTATVAITVNAVPSLTITATSPSICVGSSVGLTASGAQSYTWASSPNASVFPNTASVVSSPTITTVYTAVGINANGCTSSIGMAVTVNTVPVTTAAVSPAILCVGSTATISAGGADSYSWTIGGGSSAPTVTANPVVTTTYNLIGYSTNGCSNAITVSVPVSTLALSVTGNTSICQGKQTNLVGSGGSNLGWVGQSPFPILNVSPAATTVYTLTGIDDNSCSLTKTVNVEVNPNPTVTATSSHSVICKGESFTLTANSAGATTYTWGASAGSATTSTVVLTGNTVFTFNYNVTGTSNKGCVGTASVSVTVDACTGIQNLNYNTVAVNIYPNPNNGNFTIETNENLTLHIVNGLGQVVKAITTTESGEVSVDGLSKGIYFVIGDHNGQRISKKVIVD